MTYEVILAVAADKMAGELGDTFVKQTQCVLGIWEVCKVVSKEDDTVDAIARTAHISKQTKRVFKRHKVRVYIRYDRKSHRCPPFPSRQKTHYARF